MNLKKDFTSRDDPHKDGKHPGREIDKHFAKLKGENLREYKTMEYAPNIQP